MPFLLFAMLAAISVLTGMLNYYRGGSFRKGLAIGSVIALIVGAVAMVMLQAAASHCLATI
ncbi:MAG: hypothetical protein MK006_18500 [Pirellulales bacterium]|nr:hypothetical protein [Pirellulales bacterium]|tara:strand:+ start:191 stop:373 length:183 start_codon:yes stop_codon:yes gene_type:complete